jgi:hypothetical protein
MFGERVPHWCCFPHSTARCVCYIELCLWLIITSTCCRNSFQVLNITHAELLIPELGLRLRCVLILGPGLHFRLLSSRQPRCISILISSCCTLSVALFPRELFYSTQNPRCLMQLHTRMLSLLQMGLLAAQEDGDALPEYPCANLSGTGT